MKRNLVFIIIGFLLIIGIGGKVYLDKKAERKEAEKIEAERMSVVALKNTSAPPTVDSSLVVTMVVSSDLD